MVEVDTAKSGTGLDTENPIKYARMYVGGSISITTGTRYNQQYVACHPPPPHEVLLLPMIMTVQ